MLKKTGTFSFLNKSKYFSLRDNIYDKGLKTQKKSFKREVKKTFYAICERSIHVTIADNLSSVTRER